MKNKTVDDSKHVQKNGFIYFLKFLFSIIILIFHGRAFASNTKNIWFLYGYIGVNFYFIVSGFMFMNSIIKKNEEKINNYLGALKFLVHKLKPFILKLLLTFIFSYIILYHGNLLNFKKIFSDGLIAELLQISSVGYTYSLNASWWYLSVMFIIMFLIYPLVNKHKINFVYYFSPILILLTLGIVKYTNIAIDQHSSIKIFLMNGFYLGIIYLNLGMIAYCLSKILKEKLNMNKITCIVITFFELLGYAFILLNCWNKCSGGIFIGIVLTITVALSFSNRSYTGNLFKSNIWKKLADFGFIIYLCQIAIRRFFQYNPKLLHGTYLNKLLMYMIITMVVALIIFCLEKLLIYIYKKFLLQKLRKIFLKN